MLASLTDLLALPSLASEHGKNVDLLITLFHVLMGVLFVGWLIYFIYVLYRFRQKKAPQADPVGARSHASSYVEGAVAFLEVALLLGLGVPLWAKLVDKQNFPSPEASTQVRVVAEQFQWNFRYPGKDGIFGAQDPKFVTADNLLGYDKVDEHGKDDINAPLNEMHVPVNKPVLLRISSKDVIHSFKVTAFRYTQDAIPGLAIPGYFTPTKIGTYMITCAQLCGVGHAKMAGYVHVDSEADFQKWIEERTPKPPTPPGAPSKYE